MREDDEMNPCRRRRRSSSLSPARRRHTGRTTETSSPRCSFASPRGPSSLPRASLVCKRWRRLVTDPQFLRRFCAHHREPPIVGVFPDFYRGDLSFRSVLDSPDHIPPDRFSVRLDGIEDGGIWSFRGCRHGRVLFTGGDRLGKGCRQVLVWDPVTGDRRCLGSPPQTDHDWSKSHVQGEVLCVAGDKDHVHGGCHSSPFKVVLVCADKHVARALLIGDRLTGQSHLDSGSI